MVKWGGRGSNAEMSAATQIESASNLRRELEEHPSDEVLEVTAEWLKTEDQILGQWVNGRIRGLYEGQTSRLATARREREDLENRMTGVAGSLRTGKQELNAARRQLEELQAAQPGKGIEQLSYEQLEAVKAYPSFMGFRRERFGWDDDLGLYGLFRFLPVKEGTVYDLGDWKLRLTRIEDNDYIPLLYQLRSGMSNGNDYFNCWGGRFEFGYEDEQTFKQRITSAEMTAAFDVLWRGLLRVGRTPQSVLQQLRVVKGADPARVIPLD